MFLAGFTLQELPTPLLIEKLPLYVYNFGMPNFRYHHDIEVRFGDLDALGHLNNARFLTYMEQARIHYFKDLGLWQGESIMEIGFIVANANINFRAPVVFGQVVRVRARVSRLGNKSITMQYQLEDSQTGQSVADGSTALVVYDYRAKETAPIPQNWRETITSFEHLSIQE